MKTLLETDNEYICEVQAPCFQQLSATEIEIIKQSKTQVMFRKGENLTKQGAYASYILFVIDGLLKQYIEVDANRNYNLQLLQSGDFVGLSVIFEQTKLHYSATALRETKAFLIEKDAMKKLVKQNAMFAYTLIQRNFELETDLYGKLQHVLHKQMPGRLSDALLYLSSDTFAGENVFASLSRKDIAEFAGITTESAVKLLKTFEKDALISLNEKEITILNRNALLEISKKG